MYPKHFSSASSVVTSHQKGTLIRKLKLQLWNIWLHNKLDVSCESSHKKQAWEFTFSIYSILQMFPVWNVWLHKKRKHNLKVHIINMKKSLSLVSKVFFKCFQCGDFTSKREYNQKTHTSVVKRVISYQTWNMIWKFTLETSMKV